MNQKERVVMLKKFTTALILFVLTSCGPMYDLRYEYITPNSDKVKAARHVVFQKRICVKTNVGWQEITVKL